MLRVAHRPDPAPQHTGWNASYRMRAHGPQVARSCPQRVIFSIAYICCKASPGLHKHAAGCSAAVGACTRCACLPVSGARPQKDTASPVRALAASTMQRAMTRSPPHLPPPPTTSAAAAASAATYATGTHSTPNKANAHAKHNTQKHTSQPKKEIATACVWGAGHSCCAASTASQPRSMATAQQP